MSTRDWFCGYVIQVTSYDRISRVDHSFRFNKCITRAAVSAIASNILDRAADEDYIDQRENELNTFPDVKPSRWAYYFIMETTNGYNYTRNNGNKNWCQKSRTV